jgi:predicted Rossmann-fold nucleotide-binding protein
VVFPGGFGTMDELFEFLTLKQTHKMGHRANILLYGSKFWKRAVDFDCFMESGTISPEDMKLIHIADNPPQAFGLLKKWLKHDRRVRTAIRHPFP